MPTNQYHKNLEKKPKKKEEEAENYNYKREYALYCGIITYRYMSKIMINNF